MADPTNRKNEPIVARALTVHAMVDEEIYVSKFESWKEALSEEFPEYHKDINWEFGLAQDPQGAGPPFIDPSRLKVSETHHFKFMKDGQVLSAIQLEQNRLAIVLPRSSYNCWSYSELKEIYSRILPAYLAHFHVQKIKICQLEYVNLLSRATTPDFIEKGGDGVMIDKALTILNGYPGLQIGICQPYDCRMGLRVKHHLPCQFHVRVAGHDDADGKPCVRIDFFGSVATSDLSCSLNDLTEQFGFLHSKIREFYKATFTDVAHESFGTINQ